MASPAIKFQDPWRQRTDGRTRSAERHSSSNTINSPQERLLASPSRIDREPKKGHSRSNHLTLSLSPRPTHTSDSSSISPHRPSTVRSVPTTSPEMVGHRAPSVNLQSASTTSPDSLGAGLPIDPHYLDPLTSQEQSSPWPESLEERAPSAATVRGPSTLGRDGTPPLTPFPPWISNSSSDVEEEAGEQRRWQLNRHSAPVPGKTSYARRADWNVTMGAEGTQLISSIMHGVFLALQFLTALAVFNALAWVAIWQKSKDSDGFREWLWIYAEPCLGVILVLCAGTLIAHEVKVLSSVALLYLQSAILVVTTGTSLMLWVRSFEEDNRAAKGLLMGCNVFMWGLALFGFVRGVTLWRVEVEEGRRRLRESRYGTFIPYGDQGNDERF